jgi:hypothetical protein
MNNEEEPRLVVNINLFKFNLAMMVSGVLCSYFKNDYAYINSVYDSILLLTVYTNAVFVYILFVNRNNL